MSDTTFGIDFGTTNSLAAVSVGGKVLPLLDQVSRRPHPSVIWYRGANTLVGREARQHLDSTEGGAPPGFVKSPKMCLRRKGPIFVDGRPVEPTDAVAEVFRHLKADANLSRGAAAGYDLINAVVTIPVDFGGPERRALRQAALKAGIGITQFVHEPAAALYAYLRSNTNITRELSRLEGRSILVFDWGGGTLDLTLCRIQGGAIMQIANLGDNEVGGDRFDERLRNLLRSKHAEAHALDDISALEQPGMGAKLLNQCELVKINLSDPKIDNENVIIRNYLNVDGPSQNLVANITRKELDQQSLEIVAKGLARIDELLDSTGITYQDVELCLATGGMVKMPTIRNGLTERFLGRVPALDNGDRIIAEGAAWIASDGLRLMLSKPLEILLADTSGKGTYYPLVDQGLVLPMENEIQNVSNTRLFCTDPREGVAVIEIAKPLKLGHSSPGDARRAVCVAQVKVDQNASPLLERIECHLQIDHNFIAHLTLKSTGRGDTIQKEFHDLEFGLSLLDQQNIAANILNESTPAGSSVPLHNRNLVQRTNVAVYKETRGSFDQLWKLIPGDLVDRWRPGYFDTRNNAATLRQKAERNFYVPCATCGRRISQIIAEGLGPKCSSRCTRTS